MSQLRLLCVYASGVSISQVRRTTLSAEADDLRTLEDEARQRGVSLSALLREVVAEKAREIRLQRRPRIGIGRSGHVSISDESAADESTPARG